jgi:acid phosphatase
MTCYPTSLAKSHSEAEPMSCNVVELGAIFAVGVYLVGGMAFILYALVRQGVWIPLGGPGNGAGLGSEAEKHSARNGPPSGSPLAGLKAKAITVSVLGLTLCFMAGLLLQDIGQLFADRNSPWQQGWFLPAEDLLRTNSLFGENWEDQQQENRGLTPLSRQMADLGLLDRFAGPSGRKVQRALLQPDHLQADNEDYLRAANQLYFAARNAVDKEPSYAGELNRLRIKSDWARSFSVVSGLLLVLTILVGLVALTGPWALNWLTSRFAQQAAQYQLPPRRILLARWVGILLLLVGAWWIGKTAFVRDQEEYDLRVYGYFAALRDPALSPSGRSPGSGTTLPNLGLVKRAVTAYHDSGQWEADTAKITNAAGAYLAGLDPAGKKMAVVFDIDETALSNWPSIRTEDYGYKPKVFDAWVMTAKAPAIRPIRDLYHLAHKKGCAIFFISGRSEALRGATEKNLRAAGYPKWDGLLLKPEDYHERSIVPFKAEQRRKLTAQGYRIVANIGDQDSDLEGGWAEKSFKVPNPAYFVP